MRAIYKPRGFKQKFGYLVEELGELQSALGKSMRWGLDSYNPELPEEDRETNREWILRELADVRRAIKLVTEVLTD